MKVGIPIAGSTRRLQRIRFEVTRRGHFKALFKEASDGTLRGVIGDYFIWVLGE